MVAKFEDLDLSKRYTYRDYLTWTFKERVELLKGWIAKMSPAPSRKHQAVSGTIFFELKKVLDKGHCYLYAAPFDVRLPVSRKQGEIDTVVQPDIVVVCDESKLDDQGCNGAPDLVVEILSPGNSKKEMKTKYDLYEESGVLEYWLVEPEQEFAIVYTLNDSGKYIGSRLYTNEDKVKSDVIKGFELDLAEVFKVK